MSERPIEATLHTRGQSRLDAVCDLVQSLAMVTPLTSALNELPRRVAAVFESEVCSVYLREGHDLVMRGNVGFAHDALGEVRLAVGEGMVGTAVEISRPVSSEAAPAHKNARIFPSLGEERYPAFLAVPVPGPSGPSGAVVVQRAGAPYTAADVALLVALAGAISPLLARARIVDRETPRAPSGTRRVTLTGRAVIAGTGLGVAMALRRPEIREKSKTSKQSGQARELARWLEHCDASLDVALRTATRKSLDTAPLLQAREILADGRLTERTLELAPSRGLAGALAEVAREAIRAARLTDVAWLSERAVALAELCDALRVLGNPDTLAAVPEGAVWLGDALTVYDLLVGMRRRPSALLLPQRASEATRLVLELLELPAVAEVGGLFNWVSDGDVLLVDGDHGLVRVNPTRRERDEAREARRV
ncbi:MAG: GAF domain-containing protein [Myxococcales bacterium]|nr:GAF domain-containing protein [Myxococcales bacterium]